MSLDINLFREDRGGVPQVIKQSQKKRFADVALVDQIIALDQTWREKQFVVTKAQSGLGSIVRDIAAKKKKNENFDDLVSKTKSLQIDIDTAQQEEEKARSARDLLIRLVPNILHPSVPSSQKEKILRSLNLPAGSNNRFHFSDLLYMLNGCDLDKAGAISGRKSAFLFGPCVALSQALVSSALRHLLEAGCTLVELPSIMNKEFASQFLEPGTTSSADRLWVSVQKDEEQRFLIASSEPLFALRKGEWLSESHTSYAAVARCFRPPASRETDAHGLFGVHQMEKVVQFVLCDPDNSWDHMDQMLVIAEKFFQKLEIPYRVTIPVSSILHHAVAKQYDIECWCIAQNDFVPLCSIRHYTDFFSRQQDIRFGFKKQGELSKKFVHTIECTLVISTKLLCVFLETHQRAQEGIAIPTAVQPHLLLLPSSESKMIPFVKTAPVSLGKKQKKASASSESVTVPVTPAVLFEK